MTTQATQVTTTPAQKPSHTAMVNDAYDQYTSDQWARHLMLYVKNPKDLDDVMAGLSDDFQITVIPDEIVRTQFPENYYPVAALLGWAPVMNTPAVQLARSRMTTNILAKVSNYWPHLAISISEEPVEIQRNAAMSREYPVMFSHKSRG